MDQTIPCEVNLFYSDFDSMLIPEILTTKENKENGILVVLMPGFAERLAPGPRSFLSDRTLLLGKTLSLFCDWFTLWGMPLARTSGTEGAFERSFSVAVWPEKLPEKAHGPQLVPRIAESAFDLNAILAKRKPRLVIFLSCYLWEAMNVAKEAFALTAGAPKDKGRRLTDKRLGAYSQCWENLTTVALPIPGKNTTKDFVLSLAPAMQSVLRDTGLLPTAIQDPLLVKASQSLVFDREASIQSIRSRLHVDRERATSLFEALKGRSYETDESGRAVILKEKN